jgi:tripartite-type tricarboxylate transporter receptor subunit TctC
MNWYLIFKASCGRALAAAVLLAALASNTWAQTPVYPSKPIRLVVPFTPGGSTDILGRAVAQELTKALGQPVLVENIAGAGGSIGAERVAKAAPDGYTLLMGHIGTLAVNVSLYPKLGYDPIQSFTPIAWVARVPNVLVVNAGVPAANFKELMALAKSKPGHLNYGSGGNGSAAHTATEYLKLQTKTSMVHLPYRGTAPAVTDLIAGQIQVMFTGAPAVLAHLKTGKLRALAVSSPQRLQQLPEVPTVAESGVAGTQGFEADQWYGVVAPTGTPAAIIKLLNEQINLALSAPVMNERLLSEGAQAMPNTPAVFGKLIETEIKRWQPVIQGAGIKAD